MSVSNAVFECVQILTPAQNDKTLNSNLRLELANILVRLKIWAGNVGVFAPNNASVDYRLRDDPDLVEVVFSMTRKLKQSLLNAVSPPLLEESDEEDKGAGFGGRNDSVSSGSSSASLDLDSNAEESDSDDDSERLGPSGIFIAEANDVLNRLYRLATVFRKPQSSSENAKVQGFMKKLHEKGGVEELEDVKDHVWSHVKAHFPEAPEFLVRRLVEAAVFRRMMIKYRQRHQDKLNQGTETAFGGLEWYDEDNTTPATGMTLSTHVSKKHHSGKENYRSHSKQRRSTFSATNASSTNRANFADYERSTALSGITKAAVSRRQQLDVPGPPKNDGQDKIECPYCLRVVSQEEMTQPRWTRHILKDIDPFICLFESCKDSTLFKTVEDWLGHMRWEHTIVYSCQAVGHEQAVFDSSEDLENHIRRKHPDTFTESQLPGLIKQGTLPSSNTFGALNYSLSLDESQCLLCLQPVSLEPTDDTAPGSAVEQGIQNHILEHLEAIALLALPGDTGPDGVDSDVRQSSPGLGVEVRENDGLPLAVFEDIATERAGDENVPDLSDHDDMWFAVFQQVKQPHLQEPEKDSILIELGEEKKKTSNDEVAVEDIGVTEEKRRNEGGQFRSKLQQDMHAVPEDRSQEIPMPEILSDRGPDAETKAGKHDKAGQTTSHVDPSSGPAHSLDSSLLQEINEQSKDSGSLNLFENTGKLPGKGRGLDEDTVISSMHTPPSGALSPIKSERPLKPFTASPRPGRNSFAERSGGEGPSHTGATSQHPASGPQVRQPKQQHGNPTQNSSGTENYIRAYGITAARLQDYLERLFPGHNVSVNMTQGDYYVVNLPLPLTDVSMTYRRVGSTIVPEMTYNMQKTQLGDLYKTLRIRRRKR